MATTSPNAKVTVKNDKDAADHEIFKIGVHPNVPVKPTEADTPTKHLFSEEEADGWVIVQKSDIPEDDSPTNGKKRRRKQHAPMKFTHEESDSKNIALQIYMELFKNKAEIEKEFEERIEKYQDQIEKYQEQIRKYEKHNDILNKATEILKKTSEALQKKSVEEQDNFLRLREHNAEIRLEITREQKKLVDVRQQRIQEEMRKDNAIKLFDYVKTTIAIANAGFNQTPQL